MTTSTHFSLQMKNNLNLIWQSPSSQPVLAKNHVHIWRASLDLPAEEIDRLTTLLSEDELSRANRYRFPQHRRRFIVARGILRQLLAAYLNVDSNYLGFDYSSRGKPRLKECLFGSNLQFNISHSDELALYAITSDRRIGVDLEYLRSMDDVAKIARRFFSAAESELIASLSGNEQKQVFFELWTAKEAYLKATGEGIGGLLDGVEISLSNQDTSLLSIRGDTKLATNWLVDRFFPSVDYVATVAIETRHIEQEIKYWDWKARSSN